MKKKLIADYGLRFENFIDSGEPIPEKELLKIAIFNMKMTISDGTPLLIPGTDFLFIGSLGAAYNIDNLVEAGITHIVCLSDVIRLNFPDQFSYLRVPMHDKPDYDIRADLQTIFDFINSARELASKCTAKAIEEPLEAELTTAATALPAANAEGTESELAVNIKSDGKDQMTATSESRPQDGRSKVLVHCYQGKSRSSAVCCAYMIKYMRLTLDQALERIREVRSIASPNAGFMKILRDFERVELGLLVENDILEKEEDGDDSDSHNFIK